MFRHHDITRNGEIVILPGLFQCLFKGAAMQSSAEFLQTPVTTERYEMKLIGVVKPFESPGHNESVFPWFLRFL